MPENPVPEKAPSPSPEEQLRAQYHVKADYDPDEFADEFSRPKPASPLPAPASKSPPPEARQEQVAPPHNRALVRMALDLGWTQGQVDATPADELDVAVYHAARQRDADLRDMVRQGIYHGEHRPEDAKAPPKPAEDELEFDDEIIDPDTGEKRRVTEKDYGPGTGAGIVKHIKSQRKEIAELKSALKEFREADSKRRAAERTAAIDAIFDSLSPAHKKLLGTGAVSADQKSVEYKRRIVVLQVSGVDLDNDPAETLRAKITSGANNLFGIPDAAPPAAGEEEPEPGYPEIESIAPPPRPRATNGQYTKPTPEDEEVERRKKDFAEGALGKPSGRKAAELPPGDKKAMQTWSRGAKALFGDDDDTDRKVGY